MRFIFLRTLFAVLASALGGCSSFIDKPEHFPATTPEDVSQATELNGAIYQQNQNVPLFYNAVALHVGDVLTVVLEESTAATKSATTTTKKSTSATMPGLSVAGLPLTHNGVNITSASLNDASAFAGEGASAQSNNLTGYLSVTVSKRYSNGNLQVRGEKWITLNQGKEFIQVQGIVRPVDIGPDNSVPSYRLADAKILYGGTGTLADANTKSWLARIFDSPWMPF
jgi:flagellar L-ring protein precursor FlgH